jgi:acetoin utilization deacetylase AcuC-like enzyme
MALFEATANRRWRIAPGAYRLSAGFDAARGDASAEVALEAADLPP